MRSSPGPRLGQGKVEMPKLCGWKGCERNVPLGQMRCNEHALSIESRRTPSERRKEIMPRAMRPQVRAIAEAVSKAYGWIPIEEIRGERRERSVLRIRMVAMYAVRECTAMSYPEIAMEFGGKDHTTAISAVRSVRKWLDAQEAQTHFAVTAGIKAGRDWVANALASSVVNEAGKAAAE